MTMRPVNLPDAAINAAARAIAGIVDHDPVHDWPEFRGEARVALLAALPHLEAAIRADERRACVREVEAMAVEGWTPYSNAIVRDAAARLRAGEQTTTEGE